MDYNITYRQKDKGWQFIISYKDENGKWKQKSKQGFKSKKDAKPMADKMLEELKNNVNLKTPTDLINISFKEFTDMHLKHLKLHIEPNTLKSYICAIHAFSSLYTLPMNEINSMHIQNCIDDMVSRGLSESSIKGYLTRIKSLFRSSIETYNIINSSPIKNIRIKASKKSSSKKALSDVELNKLLNCLKVENEKYYIISLLASKCGLRIGEILGLTWDCVDFENNEIKINKQFKYINDSNFGIGELKSKNGNRIVPLPPKIAFELKVYKNSTPINIDNRLFNNRNVKSLSERLSMKYKKLGFNISVHELRHTYATNLISNGIDFKTAANLLGHDVHETMKTYSHVNDDMRSKAIKIINECI